jgi:sterol desaturase/sphingolipid hydroxylase (fatty acid hydroxylase superfamily)
MSGAGLVAAVVVAFVVGMNLWYLAEYLLHRFAMHELRGRGMMSREHLTHHVTAKFTLSSTHVLSWIGVGLVGGAVWFPVGWWVAGPWVGLALSVGWASGYASYEWTHAMCHLRPPRNRYQRWVRRHHFHHHFGAPMSNQGVTVGWWDRLFGTSELPATVRIPRRLAEGLPWLLDDDGNLRPELADDYELVGAFGTDERQAQIDRVRAFASQVPTD